MWESRVLRRAFERLELHEGKLSRAVLRGGGGGDVTSLPDTWVGNHPGLPGPDYARKDQPTPDYAREGQRPRSEASALGARWLSPARSQPLNSRHLRAWQSGSSRPTPQ